MISKQSSKNLESCSDCQEHRIKNFNFSLLAKDNFTDFDVSFIKIYKIKMRFNVKITLEYFYDVI